MCLASGCGWPGQAGGLLAPMNSLRISPRNRLASNPPGVVRVFDRPLAFGLVFGFGLAFAFVFVWVFAFVLAFFLAMRLLTPFVFDGPGGRQSLVSCKQHGCALTHRTSGTGR
jgi:hypothetical protein